jgi:hypothetical protein
MATNPIDLVDLLVDTVKFDRHGRRGQPETEPTIRAGASRGGMKVSYPSHGPTG